MLIFTGISVILTVIFVYQYFSFLRIYYIGQSLHQFRELRTELTLYLANNVKNDLTASEATEYYSLLAGIDGVIKNFDLLKVKFLQFRSYKFLTAKIVNTSQKVTAHSNSTTIQPVYLIKLQACVLTAFKAIPLCRFRFLLFIYRIMVLILIKLGFLKAKKQLNDIDLLAQAEKNISGKNGIPCSQ